MFHILVVDDDKNTRRLMRAILEAEHYNVSTAANGEDALEVMDAEHIDLVVLDIMMPNSSRGSKRIADFDGIGQTTAR